MKNDELEPREFIKELKEYLKKKNIKYTEKQKENGLKYIEFKF